MTTPDPIPADTLADQHPRHPEWQRMFAFCGQCWERTSVWVKDNIAYCTTCRPDWKPPQKAEP